MLWCGDRESVCYGVVIGSECYSVVIGRMSVMVW